jgi:hypothetical protein
MPRGSEPGTKRGGRKRGTPNRRTILANRIFVAAAAHPVAGWQELLSVLMDDQALPADTRLVIAQKSRSAAARSNRDSRQNNKCEIGRNVEPKTGRGRSRKCCWHVSYQFCGLSAEIAVYAENEAEARAKAVDQLRLRGLKVA